ncbi:MAG: glycosyltransferase family 39 protein [Desulfobacteraceae bacterium]|nr:glycosyltransferase family 39 protein [Desulfobacteraceae bacterium]
MTLPKNLIYPLILTVLWAAIYLGNISRPALLDDADSFHAEAVREMVVSGDWTTLRINNGIRYLEKAPFMYWLAAIAVSIFGQQDWAIRLPLALFSLLLTLVVYRFGKSFWGERGGLYSGLVICTALGPFAFTRTFIPDVILATFLAFCLYMYLLISTSSEEDKSHRIGPVDLRCAALFASAALALITKGLVGVIFTGTIIFAHIVVTGNWKVLKRFQFRYGIPIFLLIAAPWHIAAGLANSDFFWFYFVREHLLRYLGMRYPKDYDTVPLLVFWALLLVWLFPWSGFIWGLIRNFPRKIRNLERTEQACLFLFLWIAVILTFFAFSTTQEYYCFPTLAAFALLIGKGLSDLDSPEGASRKWGLVGLGTTASITLLAGAGLIALAWIGSDGYTNLSGTLTVNPDQYNLAFGHMHDLTPATFGFLAPLVYRTASYLIVGPLVAFLFAALWKRWIISFLFLAITMVGLSHSFSSGMVAFEPVLSSKNLAKIVEYHYRPGDKIVINDFYEKGSTLNYYTGLQVHVMDSGFGVLWYGLQDATAPKLTLDENTLIEQWNSGQRIFLFSERPPLEAFLAKHPDFRYRVLADEGGKKILINW